MTTPPIAELLPGQIQRLNARTALERWWTQGIPLWTAPPGDAVKRSAKPVVKVTGSKPYGLGEAYRSAVVRPVNGSVLSGESLRGIPMEAVPTDAPLVDVLVYSPNHGRPRIERVPLPYRPWIEGHPHVGGEFDRHWVGVYPDGSGWELIQLSWIPFFGGLWQAQECSQWSAKGEVISGYPVTAGRRRLADMVVTKAALAACAGPAGLVLNNYAGGDGTLSGPGVPRCGDHVVYRPTADTKRPGGDAGLMFDIATGPGLVIFDRGGNAAVPSGNIPTQSGAHWAGSNIADLSIPMARLELVTSTT